MSTPHDKRRKHANPALDAKLPYDAVKDLAPVVPMAESPMFLFVPPSLPVNSVTELVAHIDASPGMAPRD